MGPRHPVVTLFGPLTELLIGCLDFYLPFQVNLVRLSLLPLYVNYHSAVKKLPYVWSSSSVPMNAYNM